MTNKQELGELFDLAVKFHGHRCPAMPLGLRAGLAAMEKLGVPRAQNKELYVLSETGPAHAMACFLDGVQVATGCTYGKGNVERLDHYRLAFTLIDVKTRRAVRVVVNPDRQEKSLQGEFVKLRSQGVEPQDVPPEITDPIIYAVMADPEEELFTVSEVFEIDFQPPSGTFEWLRCDNCGEGIFAPGARITDGKVTCLRCQSITHAPSSPTLLGPQ